MKFIILTSLIIGISFVGADLGGTLKGVVTLIPYTLVATNGFNKGAGANKALAKALESTSNCGSSGSNQNLLNVAEGINKVAQEFLTLAEAIRNQTKDGQLNLLTGDISQITIQIKNAGDALDSLGDVTFTLADNIDSESFEDVDKVVASVKKLQNGSAEFNDAFTSLDLVFSRLLLKVGSLTILTGFTGSVHNFADSYETESEAVKDFENRCKISSGLPEALSDYAETGNTIYENLRLLE